MFRRSTRQSWPRLRPSRSVASTKRSSPALEAEQQALRSQALESAQREKERILEEASRLAERARLEAHQIAEREVEQARRTLREDVAEQAVAIATELIRAQLRPDDQRRLVNELVEKVGG